MKLKIFLINEDNTKERFELTPKEAFALGDSILIACVADTILISEKEETAILAMHVAPTGMNRTKAYEAGVQAITLAREESQRPTSRPELPGFGGLIG